MSRTKIAPTLRYAHPKPMSPREVMTGKRREAVRAYNGAQAYRELMAVLAVVRAADDHSHAEVEPVPEGEEETCPICRALARAARVSGRKP